MRRAVLFVVAFALAGGVLLLLPPKAHVLQPTPGLVAPVRGAIHIHTRRSDGSGTVESVAAAASRAGLQFVIVTDHGDATRAPSPPQYLSNVLVIDAVEISTWGGHVVALDLPKAPYPLAGAPRDVVEDIGRLGGFSIIAHPVNDKPTAQWTDWEAPFDGMEWLNLDSEWRDESKPDLARVVVAYPFRHVESLGLLLDRSDGTMAWFDALTRRRRIVAVAAADAHARVGLNAEEPFRRGASIPIPGYESLFRTFSIALPGITLGGDAAADTQAVIRAIRAGHVFSSVDALAPQPAFAFTATSGGNQASGGDVLPVGGPVVLNVAAQAAAGARIVLFKDGAVARVVTASTLSFDAGEQPGVYRVEVMLPNAPGQPSVPWIVSNPIYVGYPTTTAPVPERIVAKDVAPIYGDGPATGWKVEHSRTAQAALDVVKAVGGTQLQLRFALSGAPSDSPHAALEYAAGTELQKYARLTFVARGDNPMRASVQVRAPRGNAEADRWQRSVYVDETPREISIAFDEMSPVGNTEARRPPLDRVQSLLFVIDTVNTAIGTSGRLLIDNVRYQR